MAAELRERGVYRLGDRELIAGEGHEGGWVLYTRAEWAATAGADLEVQPDGVITRFGEPTDYGVQHLVDTGETVEDGDDGR